MRSPLRAVTMALVVALAAAPAWALKPGDQAPAFSCRALQGKPVSSAELSGKVIALCFWATWGKHCPEELKDLQALEAELRDQGLAVLAINERESEAQVASFLEENGLELRVLLDDGETARAFTVNGLPDLLVLDRRGILRGRIPGYGPGDLDRVRNLVQPLLEAPETAPPARPKPAAAASEVPAALRAYAHLQLGAAHVNIGDAFVNAGFRDDGHYTEAANELRAGLVLDPRNVELLVWLGVALEKKGDADEALRQYRTALNLDPANLFAKEGVRRLAPEPSPPTEER
jgi:peroxiredoxin